MATFLKVQMRPLAQAWAATKREPSDRVSHEKAIQRRVPSSLASSSDVAAARLRALWYKGLVDLGLGEA